MMVRNAQQLGKELRHILARGEPSTTDLMSLIGAGERLRLVLLGQEDPSETDRQTLSEYENALGDRRDALPTDLVDRLAAMIEQLAQYGGQSLAARDVSDGKRALDAMEDVLSTGAAAVHLGLLDRVELSSLALKATAAVGELAPKLQDLWDTADERLRVYGVDPEFADVMGFLGELAQFASERVELRVAVHEARKKKSIINELVAGFATPQPENTRTPFWEPLVAKLKGLVTIPIPMPELVLQGTYSSGQTIPAEIKILHDFDGRLVIQRQGARLMFWVPDGHTIEAESCRVGQTEMKLEQSQANIISLVLDANNGSTSIHATIRVDGQSIELPVIEIQTAP